MSTVQGVIQQVEVSGGLCCIWLGVNPSELYCLSLGGTTIEAANNGAAVALALAAQLRGEAVTLTTNGDRHVTELKCGKVTVALLGVADYRPYPSKAELAGYAPLSHRHDELYAPSEHRHDELYAPTLHDHGNQYAPAQHQHDDRYALVGHGHGDQYAPAVHLHDDRYASLTHHHDGRYAAAQHDHQGTYAPVVHGHGDQYAPAGHLHDDRYAATDHQHDGRYAPVAHGHDGQYAPVTHDHDARYALSTHQHDGRYAPVAHGHDGQYALAAHNHQHDALMGRLPQEHMLTFEARFVLTVLPGAPLQALTASAVPAFGPLLAELDAPGQTRQAYVTRGGVSTLSAVVKESGTVMQVLSPALELDASAQELGWRLKLFTASGDEYTRPGPMSEEEVHFSVITHLNAL